MRLTEIFKPRFVEMIEEGPGEYRFEQTGGWLSPQTHVEISPVVITLVVSFLFYTIDQITFADHEPGLLVPLVLVAFTGGSFVLIGWFVRSTSDLTRLEFRDDVLVAHWNKRVARIPRSAIGRVVSVDYGFVQTVSAKIDTSDFHGEDLLRIPRSKSGSFVSAPEGLPRGSAEELFERLTDWSGIEGERQLRRQARPFRSAILASAVAMILTLIVAPLFVRSPEGFILGKGFLLQLLFGPMIAWLIALLIREAYGRAELTEDE